jgi:hypothetical protein
MLRLTAVLLERAVLVLVNKLKKRAIVADAALA